VGGAAVLRRSVAPFVSPEGIVKLVFAFQGCENTSSNLPALIHYTFSAELYQKMDPEMRS
jgi:hypothetical protein